MEDELDFDKIKKIKERMELNEYLYSYILLKKENYNITEIDENEKIYEVSLKEQDIVFKISEQGKQDAEKIERVLKGEYIKECIKECINKKYMEKKINDESLSDDLIKYIINILNINSGNQILDICSPNEKFSFVTEKEVNEVQIDAFEDDDYYYQLNRVKKYINESNINLIHNNILIAEVKTNKYDVAFFDSKAILLYDNQRSVKECLKRDIKEIVGNEIKDTQSTFWMLACKIINSLNKHGKAVIITSVLYLQSMFDTEIRKKLIEKGYIESIIELPIESKRLSRIKYLIVLNKEGNNKKTIDFIDLKDCYCQYKGKNIFDINSVGEHYNNKTTVNIENIKEFDYSLNPNLYYNSEKITINNPTNFSELVIDYGRGYQIFRDMERYVVENEEDANCKMLGIGNIDEDGNLDNNYILLNLHEGKDIKNYLLEDGDLLLSARGEKIKKHVLKVKKGEKIISNGSVFYVRVNKEKINPLFLKIFLDSKKGEIILNKAKIGNVIPLLSLKTLLKMNISCPPMEEQKKIIEEYQKKEEEVKKVQEKLEKLKRDLDKIRNKV